MILSFGANGRPGGTEDDTDIVVRYRGALRVQRAQLIATRPGRARLRLTFTKPYRLTGDPLSDLVLVVDGRRHCTLPLARSGWSHELKQSDPARGVMVITGPTLDLAGVALELPRCAIDIAQRVLETSPDGDVRSRSVIRERSAAGGPCNASVEAPAAIVPDGAHPAELIGDEIRAAQIERLNACAREQHLEVDGPR